MKLSRESLLKPPTLKHQLTPCGGRNIFDFLVSQITNYPIETNSGITIPAKTFTYNDNIRYAALYLLFSYFWTSEFIVAIGQVR